MATVWRWLSAAQGGGLAGVGLGLGERAFAALGGALGQVVEVPFEALAVALAHPGDLLGDRAGAR
ncbi:hypothetical protein ACGFX4_22845 [Kitasatospora sp. NPDC048365]|uniref:hypothetical protein n=1 Tax=Kitasatospora sp. NPDC048365 TaxID=3364050 RepID=UPI00371D94B1